MLDALEDLEAVQVRQIEVQQHHVPVLLPHPRQRFLAVAGLAGDGEIRGVGEKPLHALAHHGVIVRDQYPYHLLRSPYPSGSRSPRAVPPPGTGVMESWPRRNWARSCMPMTPKEPGGVR